MGIGSIVLGVLAVVCMIGGFLATLVPFMGTMLSFLSPLLALAGIVLGGVALSRSRGGGEESEGVAIGGLVTNVVVLVPSFLVAVTCGLCNTCVTSIALAPPHDSGPRAIFPDAGHFGGYPMPTYPSPTYPSPTYPSPTYPSPTYPSPTYPSPTYPGPTPPSLEPAPTPVLPGGPALPPPPLPAGPTRVR